MTSCPHCGEVRVIVDHTKAGHPYLRDYGAPHKFTCTVNKKRRPKARTALGELMSLNISREDADRIIKAHPKASDDELILVALKEKE